MSDHEKDGLTERKADGREHATTEGAASAGAGTGAVVGGVGGAMAGGPVGAAVGAAIGAAGGAAGGFGADRAMHSDDDRETDSTSTTADHEHVYTADRCDTCGSARIV